MSILWLVLVAVFAVVEGVTVALTSIWFAVGAVVGFFLALVGAPFWIQTTGFILVSAVSMALLRPLVKKYMIPKQIPTNADRNIGKIAVVTEEISNLNAKGTIVVEGMTWTARSEVEKTVIAAGSSVKILRIEGVKCIVTPDLY